MNNQYIISPVLEFYMKEHYNVYIIYTLSLAKEWFPRVVYNLQNEIK